ncbi:RNA polymerase, sigma 32 subunit, RpoH [Tistlia consotensis]|uniref:RNA polymerase sigma factor n=1 Tax=Tistlia consotensis USBA 355 TaxID=560819 RepID=A0A1Y6C0S7_9PROT|nr:RNA polymerase factor sigma-32 [Tistlia consotensis]SMF38462.1 RNA polymerase, sigma 32 subunit, RpoH [Tistlia consotensis USBA 355]SNR37141.1 RNA polymerase, sigma 32 subunit, RpoH [Tistlia consotensis]
MALIETAEAQRANAGFIRRSMAEPLLSREREFALARAWREQGDERALHQLTRSYMRLVVAVAAKFRHYGLPMSDLVQEGSVGLMQAAARFEPERDIRFSTYATWWIRSAIQDFILRNWSIVRTGTTAAQKSLFFNLRRLRAQIEEASGERLSQAGRAKIAAALKVDVAEVEAMESRLSASDQSLNAGIGEEGDDEWQDFLSDERPSPEEHIVVSHDGAVRSRWLSAALGRLDRRERTIIEARRLTDEGATLEELGQRLGVSKERVRQLEHRALGKLRKAIMENSTLPSDLLMED